VLLEGKVPLLEGLGEVQIFIQLVAVDRDLDARDWLPAPHVVSHGNLIGEPTTVRL
jgi:hypothetical protein